MIADLLPPGVASAEAFHDVPEARLFAAEEAFIANAVDKRRREFATVRACARTALGELGVPPAPMLPGTRGAPTWPAGIVGSMTHCAGYRAAAVARVGAIRSLGIDAEPHLNLPEGVLDSISRPEERRQIAEFSILHGAICWDRILFSAKESVYKTWFPLTGRWLDFEDARVTFHIARPTFSALILTDGSAREGASLSRLSGRWLVRDGLLITAIALLHGGDR